MNNFKYKLNDKFILHDRWTEAFIESFQKGIIPNWYFYFPFGETKFLFRYTGSSVKIIERTKTVEGICKYKLEFNTEEYYNLTESQKDLIWIKESDIPIIMDKSSFLGRKSE